MWVIILYFHCSVFNVCAWWLGQIMSYLEKSGFDQRQFGTIMTPSPVSFHFIYLEWDQSDINMWNMGYWRFSFIWTQITALPLDSHYHNIISVKFQVATITKFVDNWQVLEVQCENVDGLGRAERKKSNLWRNQHHKSTDACTSTFLILYTHKKNMLQSISQSQ